MTPSKTMFLQIGRRRYQVASFQEASEMFCRARDVMGEGASKTPKALIVDEMGKAFARISYNGRVWAGTEYDPNATPIYDNGSGLCADFSRVEA